MKLEQKNLLQLVRLRFTVCCVGICIRKPRANLYLGHSECRCWPRPGDQVAAPRPAPGYLPKGHNLLTRNSILYALTTGTNLDRVVVTIQNLDCSRLVCFPTSSIGSAKKRYSMILFIIPIHRSDGKPTGVQRYSQCMS